jgi:ribose/xylose/arabinose/galactoside ABC-type transport system permease subunit
MQPLTRQWRKLHALQPFAVLGVMAVTLVVVPHIVGGTVDTFTVYTILQAFSDFGLVVLGLGLTMVVGEYDLSTAAVYAWCGLLAVKCGAGSPLLGVAVAVAAGVAAGAAQGGIMVTMGISSVPVTLGGYLILAGATSALAHGTPVPYNDVTLGIDLNQQILGVFSPRSFVVLFLFAVAAAVMHWTRIGRNVRAVGGDRRASRTAGVRVGRTVVGVMVASGALCALGGALSSLSVATGPSDVTVTPLTFGTIAAILGGVTLAGGRGTPLGMAAGGISLATLNQTLAIVGAADYVSTLVTGALLMAVTILTARERGWLQTLRSRAARQSRVRADPSR